MEEKKKRELSMDEMDKISGGGGKEWFFDRKGLYTICDCGGKCYNAGVKDGWYVYACSDCGATYRGEIWKQPSISPADASGRLI